MPKQGSYTDLTLAQLQADIDWICNSPALVASYNGYADILANDSISKALPINILQERIAEKHPKRLGRYYEILCHFLLEYGLGFTPVKTSLRVQEEKLTIGELDGVFEKNGNYIHVEYTLKMYLALEKHDLKNPHHFVGTFLKDALGKKHQKLFEHQLPLGTHPLVTDALGKEVDISAHLCRGRLFYPYNNFYKNNITAPDIVNPSHKKGFWVRSENALAALQDYNLIVLDKCYWLAHHPLEIATTNAEIIAEINETNTPLMVACYKNNQEAMRGFIVPNDWATELFD